MLNVHSWYLCLPCRVINISDLECDFESTVGGSSVLVPCCVGMRGVALEAVGCSIPVSFVALLAILSGATPGMSSVAPVESALVSAVSVVVVWLNGGQ